MPVSLSDGAIVISEEDASVEISEEEVEDAPDSAVAADPFTSPRLPDAHGDEVDVDRMVSEAFRVPEEAKPKAEDKSSSLNASVNRLHRIEKFLGADFKPARDLTDAETIELETLLVESSWPKDADKAAKALRLALLTFDGKTSFKPGGGWETQSPKSLLTFLFESLRGCKSANAKTVLDKLNKHKPAF